MIVYSVTISLDKKDGPAWKTYMLDKHMNDVVQTGCFTHAHLREVLDEDQDRISYVGEYFAPDQGALERYYSDFADAMRKDAQKRFEGKITAERKVYKLIQA